MNPCVRPCGLCGGLMMADNLLWFVGCYCLAYAGEIVRHESLCAPLRVVRWVNAGLVRGTNDL